MGSSQQALLPSTARVPFRPTARGPHRYLHVTGGLAQTALIHWHLLSLDAPTVAALWVVLIARSAGVALPWSTPLAMFLAVWLLYAADRLLDARAINTTHPGRPKGVSAPESFSAPGERKLICPDGTWRAHPLFAQEPLLEARHYFHARHRAGFRTGLLLATILLCALLGRLGAEALRLALPLGSALLVWLLLVHLRSPSDPRAPHASRLPKELAVGVFFPAAVFLPTVARAPGLRLCLLPDALLFATVCSLNCLYIYAWEHPFDHRRKRSGTRAVGKPEDAHWSTRWALRHLPRLNAASATLACAVVLFALFGNHPSHPPLLLAGPATACALCLFVLGWLHRHRHRFGPVLLRAAADCALLTPVILLAALALVQWRD